MFPQEQHLQLAQALGLPLYQPTWHMPAYQIGHYGKWRLTQSGFYLDRGYRGQHWAVTGIPLLLREHDGQELTWMSLSPHEIESQELACQYARGDCVVMGLGMGWVAINMALNPDVRSVTVIELDPDVIALFEHSQACAGLPPSVIAKLRIIEHNALHWQPDRPVDFLYVDIWRCLEEPQTLDDVRRMQANVQAKIIYFWGQELTIHAYAESALQKATDPTSRKLVIQDCIAQQIGLPLLHPQDFDYPQMIIDVVQSRRAHNPSPAGTTPKPSITRRAIHEGDREFLFQLYASTRSEEAQFFAMNAEQWQNFLRSQFDLQHQQYQQNYPDAAFDLLCLNEEPIGRLYVDRTPDRIHLIEISLLPQYQRQGIGSSLMQALQQEADASQTTISLRVQKSNTAQDFYHRHGFEISHDEMVFWQMQRKPLQEVTP